MKKDDFLKLGVAEDIAEKCESEFAHFSQLLEQKLADQQKAHAAELERLRLDYAVDSALAKAGAKNRKAVRALLELDRVSVAEDGTLSGLDEQLDALAKSDGYLFNPKKESARHFSGFEPGYPSDGAPKPDVDFSQMTYSQMVAYAQNNPNVKFN